MTGHSCGRGVVGECLSLSEKCPAKAGCEYCSRLDKRGQIMQNRPRLALSPMEDSMGFFEKIDLWILDQFYQPAADWFNNQFGKSCFWLARICYAVIFIEATRMTVLMYHSGEMSFGRVIFAIIVLAGWTIWSFYRTIKEEKSLGKHYSRVTFNSGRPFNSYAFVGVFRLGMFLMSCTYTLVNCLLFFSALYVRNGWALFHILELQVFLISIGSAEYFAACTPKPRKPKEVRVPAAMQPSFSAT